MIRKYEWNIIGLVSVALMVGITLFASFNLYYGYQLDLPYYSNINMSLDIIGMCVCIIFFTTTLFDHRISMATIYFMAMLTLECLLLFWDFEAWHVNNNPSKALFNKIVNYYVYGFILLIMIAFWTYLEQLIPKKDRTLKRIELFYYVVLIAGMLIIITNPWTKLLFDVDMTTGAYARKDTFILAMIAPFIMLILNSIVTYRYIEGTRKKLALYSYTVLPLAGSIIQLYTFGIGILYISLLFSVVLIYGNFYVERGQELAKKQSELVERNVTQMMAQIQPKFLYHSLRAISNIEGTPEETKKAIRDFGKYMRGNLNTLSDTKAIPFSKEMEHVNTYIDLEKLRFKDKLTVNYDIQDEDFEIPALTLQMLVENAIKHGITIRESGGTVTIKTGKTEKGHMITVIDDGVGFDTSIPPKDDSRSHVGLSNTKQRLKEMVGGSLSIDSKIGVGTTATVLIPMKTS